MILIPLAGGTPTFWLACPGQKHGVPRGETISRSGLDYNIPYHVAKNKTDMFGKNVPYN